MDVETPSVVTRVLDVTRTERTIEFTLSSDAILVDRVVPQACEHLQGHGLAEFEALRLVLRELLLNAIEHGNGNDPRKVVKCCIERMRGAMVQVSVEDQGKGFRHRDLDISMPEDPQQLRHRGFALIDAHSEAIQFNESGNQVTVFVRTASGPVFHVDDDDGCQVIHACADLTASVAEEFRLLLLRLVNAGHSRFRFDLEEVEDIDSVTLSVLFVLAKMLADRGCEAELEIVHANNSLLTLFRMTRLDRTYSIPAN